MGRLSRIDGAIEAVVLARTKCPFSDTYAGRKVHAVGQACSECGQRSNGDGGRCLVDRAEHEAITDIERALA